MIRGHVALIRQLQSFMETSGLPWTGVQFKEQEDERLEVAFVHNGKPVDIYLIAPTPERRDGAENFPLGKLAGRCGEQVVKGPLDQSTWDRIVRLIND